MMEEIDPMTGLPIMPMQPNRAGAPPRSINDMSQMGSIVDPGMQSAKQAEDYARFNSMAMNLGFIKAKTLEKDPNATTMVVDGKTMPIKKLKY